MMDLPSSRPLPVIFDFNKKADIHDWLILDDGVMGGKSAGNFSLNAAGVGVFEGNISLDNNGGFSSLRYKFGRTEIKGYTKFIIKLLGDGKKYQFRIKSNSEDYFSYVMPFLTAGEWEEIEISFRDMYAWFRGRKLDQANFSGDYIEEISFLIGNKNQEEFKLLIDRIAVK